MKFCKAKVGPRRLSGLKRKLFGILVNWSVAFSQVNSKKTIWSMPMEPISSSIWSTAKLYGLMEKMRYATPMSYREMKEALCLCALVEVLLHSLNLNFPLLLLIQQESEKSHPWCFRRRPRGRIPNLSQGLHGQEDYGLVVQRNNSYWTIAASASMNYEHRQLQHSQHIGGSSPHCRKNTDLSKLHPIQHDSAN